MTQSKCEVSNDVMKSCKAYARRFRISCGVGGWIVGRKRHERAFQLRASVSLLALITTADIRLLEIWRTR